MDSLTKADAESRLFQFDFTNTTEVSGGETLTGTPVVSATPSGLTIGSPSITGASKKVSVRISAGTAGLSYIVSCVVSTSGGNTLEAGGKLVVVDA